MEAAKPLRPAEISVGMRNRVRLDTRRGHIHIEHCLLAPFLKRCMEAGLFDVIKLKQVKELISQHEANDQWSRTQFLTATACIQSIAPHFFPDTLCPEPKMPAPMNKDWKFDYLQAASETWHLFYALLDAIDEYNLERNQGNVQFVNQL